ncbi:transcriptional regulator [Hydrogenovibrio sp. SC-1]|uniref:BolA family protein n=1 Tax=Hydrogenovibrio sp. SC-1 TaxID=2065820 RepID=UPI000C7B9739|nr:BolA family protein [Hydrogenovibrio sp. SC-1]PLA75106.1 transcriptional regulator [Hydrogenovibrio sp. SC-1]
MNDNQASIAQQIETAIHQIFEVTEFQLQNESHMHSGPAIESHFKLTLVSDDFDGVRKVKRHQLVYQALADLMPQFHALALHTYSPAEWSQSPQVVESPLCQGGGK